MPEETEFQKKEITRRGEMSDEQYLTSISNRIIRGDLAFSEKLEVEVQGNLILIRGNLFDPAIVDAENEKKEAEDAGDNNSDEGVGKDDEGSEETGAPVWTPPAETGEGSE